VGYTWRGENKEFLPKGKDMIYVFTTRDVDGLEGVTGSGRRLKLDKVTGWVLLFLGKQKDKGGRLLNGRVVEGLFIDFVQ